MNEEKDLEPYDEMCDRQELIDMAVTLAAAIRSREALSPETVAREAVATARAILAEVEGKK